MKATGHLNAVEEPFEGMFTQGMVVHETYRGPDGWVKPVDVKVEEVDGKRTASLLTDGTPIEIGSIEKMSKSKKNVVDPDDIIGSYGADTARWFMLSEFAARTRRDLDRGRRRRRASLRAAHLAAGVGGSSGACRRCA